MKRKSTEQVAALAANGTTNDPFAGIGDIRRTKQATQNVTIWTGKMKFRNGVRANIEMTAIKDTAYRFKLVEPGSWKTLSEFSATPFCGRLQQSIKAPNIGDMILRVVKTNREPAFMQLCERDLFEERNRVF